MKQRSQISLSDMMERFHSEDKCHAYLEHIRWPAGVCCPRCGSLGVNRLKTRRYFQCADCDYQYTVRIGTILQDSKLPLWKWFFAIYMMCESKKGVSANQLKRMLKVSYKTAWYLCHRIRAAMKDDCPEPLRGVVEVDETWFGGHRRGVGSGRTDHMTMVMGAVQRDGDVRVEAKTGLPRSGPVVKEFIAEAVHDEAETIITDQFPGYRGLNDHNTEHKTINHSQEWVSADVHTNTIEGVWSLFKRSIVGSYHKLSVKHLPAYLDEMAFRYNNRDNPFMFRDTLKRLIEAEPLTYRKLVDRAAA